VEKEPAKFQGFVEKRKHFHTKLTATSQSDEVFAQQWHIQYVDGRGGTTKIITRSFHEISRFDCTNKSCGHCDVSMMFKGLQQSRTHKNTEATKMRLTINQNSCRLDQQKGFLMDVTYTQLKPGLGSS